MYRLILYLRDVEDGTCPSRDGAPADPSLCTPKRLLFVIERSILGNLR